MNINKNNKVNPNQVSLVAPLGPLALLYVIYFVAICVGAVISNNAVVVLMFPIVCLTGLEPQPSRLEIASRSICHSHVRASLWTGGSRVRGGGHLVEGAWVRVRVGVRVRVSYPYP